MPKHIYLIAGESSGDFLGAQLMKALKSEQPDIIFSGIGGDLMAAEGLKSFFSMQELSLMGVTEILPKIPQLLKRIQETIDDVVIKKPDLVLTIDAPDFSFRVHKGLRKNMISPPKLVHYVAPTVWAWRPKRAKKIAQFLDGLICLFNFEPSYFENEGLKAIAVGHPMMESGVLESMPLLIGESHRKKVGLFLGSRQGELKRTAPILLQAIKKISATNSNIEIIAPTLPHLKAQIVTMLEPLGLPFHVSTDREKKWAVFKACDIALAVSGTVGLELVAANVPHVIAYRANPLTALLLKKIIKTPYAHLGNIILSRPVIPEFIQEKCNADDISQTAVALLGNNYIADKQKDAFAKIRQEIGSKIPPSKKAAKYLLSLL